MTTTPSPSRARVVKVELVRRAAITTDVFHDGPFETLADVEYGTADWVD